MKLSLFKTLGLCVLSCIFFESCFKDECQNTRVFYQYDPIYLSLEQIRSSFKVSGPKILKEAGKIYVYGDYLFINEPKEGIHVINNSNPSNPVFTSFIEIPGNIDLAIKDDVLFADNYTDLLSIDIADPNNCTLKCRIKDVFKPIFIDPSRGLLVDYKKTELTRKLSCNDECFNCEWFREGDIILSGVNKKGGGTGSAALGLGGSTARFTINSSYLYTVDISDLYTFDLSGLCPELKNKVNIGWNIETIYPYQDKLFIGSTNGMFLYSLSDPSKPSLVGSMSHWSSCDPVVSEGHFAYVTLHGGTKCNGFENQLDIVDVSNIYSPILLKTYTMKSPSGLSIKNNVLYLCDDGLKVIDVQDWKDIKTLYHNSSVSTTDVIVYPDRNQAIITGDKGILQYDITNPRNLIQISFIPVQ
ncbi:MAG: hypothetical protein ABIO44_05820 [Saprospiraceae bacterium]